MNAPVHIINFILYIISISIYNVHTHTYQDANYFLRLFVIYRDTVDLFQLVSDMYQPWTQQRVEWIARELKRPHPALYKFIQCTKPSQASCKQTKHLGAVRSAFVYKEEVH